MGARELPESSRLWSAGLATAAELMTGGGLSRADIRRMVRRGVLLPLGRGVYAHKARLADVAGDPVGDHALRLAAALRVADAWPAAGRAGRGGLGSTVGSHQSAAVVHGLAMLERIPAVVSVTHPPGGSASRKCRPGVLLHEAALPAGHVCVRRGLRVTTAARTVVDLARITDFRAGVVVADSALGGHLTSKAELLAVTADCARWPGIGRARQVVAFADGRSESALESISRVAFREHGLPPSELQVWVGGGDNGVIGRADFLWRRYRTIGEAGGALKYADGRRAIFQLERDARLRAAGFEVVHFTWQQVTITPGQVAAAIRTAFARAAASS